MLLVEELGRDGSVWTLQPAALARRAPGGRRPRVNEGDEGW
ncbi:hypothetical protein [Geodermatophilus obscurus]|nr:hypothetical protein [Geodermatophilus obscurus]